VCVAAGQEQDVVSGDQIWKDGEGTGGMAATITEYPVRNPQTALRSSFFANKSMGRSGYVAATNWRRGLEAAGSGSMAAGDTSTAAGTIDSDPRADCDEAGSESNVARSIPM
jgi:hypothetical protein